MLISVHRRVLDAWGAKSIWRGGWILLVATALIHASGVRAWAQEGTHGEKPTASGASTESGPRQVEPAPSDATSLAGSIESLTQDARLKWALFLVVVLQAVVSVLALFLLLRRTKSLLMEMRRAAVRHVYDGWKQVNEHEVQYPELHRLLMPTDVLQTVGASLNESELRLRALSLLVFDQFSLMYHQGEYITWWERAHRPARWLLSWIGLARWWDWKRDQNRSLLDINRQYLIDVMRNPLARRCWVDWRLGETWEGTRFARDVEDILKKAPTTEEPHASDRQEPNSAVGRDPAPAPAVNPREGDGAASDAEVLVWSVHTRLVHTVDCSVAKRISQEHMRRRS